MGLPHLVRDPFPVNVSGHGFTQSDSTWKSETRSYGRPGSGLPVEYLGWMWHKLTMRYSKRLLPTFCVFLIALQWAGLVLADQVNQATQTISVSSPPDTSHVFLVQKNPYAPVAKPADDQVVNDHQKKSPKDTSISLDGHSGNNTRPSGAVGNLRHRFSFD